MTYQSTVVDSLTNLYDRVIWVLPNLLASIIVLILGWLLGSLLSGFIQKILEAIKLDQLANQLGMNRLSDRVGKKLSLSAFGGWLVKWFFFLGSFIAAADILGLSGVSAFLYEQVLSYAGQVIIAMAILFLGILAANFFSGLVASSVKASGLTVSAGALSTITRWAIVIFAVIAALSQLQVATDFLTDLFRAVVAMLAIAGGIAFGLGGRDHAKKILDEVENNLTKKV
jgi:hypothetical protein